MSKELVISSSHHETRVAIMEDDQLVEIYFQRANEYSLAGSIHKGRVTRVLPGMQSAFVDLGLDRDTFLYVSDFFEENGEEYDRIETKPAKSSQGHSRQEPVQPQPPLIEAQQPAVSEDRVELETAASEAQEEPADGAPVQTAAAGQEQRDRRGRRGPAPPDSRAWVSRIEVRIRLSEHACDAGSIRSRRRGTGDRSGRGVPSSR